MRPVSTFLIMQLSNSRVKLPCQTPGAVRFERGTGSPFSRLFSNFFREMGQELFGYSILET